MAVQRSNHQAYRAARDLLVAHRDDYDAAVAGFTWPAITGSFNWAIDWFDLIARGNPRPALCLVGLQGPPQIHSFDDLAHRSDRLAAWFERHGIGRGDIVLVMLDNQIELWDSMLALMKIGAVIAPTTVAVSVPELRERIERLGARGIVLRPEDAHMVGFAEDLATPLTTFVAGPPPTGVAGGWHDIRPAQDEPDPPAYSSRTLSTDPLLLYFTSGTTTQPKLVLHTQTSYPVGHLSTMYWLGVGADDTHLTLASPGWAKHAWGCLFAPWIAQACICAVDFAHFDADSLLNRMAEVGVTSFCAPPTVWRMLARADLAGRRGALREVTSAGAPLNPDIIGAVQAAWGLTLRDGFGQTETTCLVGNSPGQPVLARSMGRPMPGVNVVLVDPVTIAPTDSEGELCLDLADHPVNLMAGYQGDPLRAAESMADGYYHTGDLVTRDDEGFIRFAGRTDDLFTSSDYKISPFEVESVLAGHPAVSQAVVVPAPDPLRLAVPKVFVELAPGWEPTAATALALFRHSHDNLSRHQQLRRLEFTDLPRTESGKVRRVELRHLEELRARAARIPAEFRDEDFPELH